MSEQAKNLVIALIIGAIGSWLVLEIGPRACNKSRPDTRREVAAFAVRVCQVYVAGDRDALLEVLVRPADHSPDKRYGWLPYTGSKMEQFPAWTDRVRAELAQFDRAGARPEHCRAVADAPPATPDAQGRIAAIPVEVAVAGQPPRRMMVGPSVASQRGRVLQGDEAGRFVRWVP